MPSKLEQLRSGEAVEIEPGLVGRLNQQDRTLELSNGRKIDASRNSDYFPQGEEQRLHSLEKEKIRKENASSPLGEFGFQLGESGLFGAAKNWANKLDLTQTGDEYLRNKRARSEVSEQISEESPYTSLAATATSFIPDLLLTKGMGAGRAGASLAAAHAGPRIVEEPLKVAGEVAGGGAAGYVFGKGVDWVGNVAARRGASRQVAQQAKEVPLRNAAAEAAIGAENAEQRGAYNLLKERVGNENSALMHQHKLNVDAHQKRALEAKNSYEKAKFDRESQIFRIKQEKEAAKATRSADQARLDREYDLKVEAWKNEKKALEEAAAFEEKQYQQALKDLPNLQKQAQSEYGKKVVSAAEDIEKAFHQEGRITANQLQVAQFLDAEISKGNLAGSSPARSAERVIKSLFPEGENIGAKELSKRYQSLESAIQRSTPESAQILTKFKEHIGERLPSALADNIAYKTAFPTFRNQITKEVEKAIHSLKIPSTGDVSHAALAGKAKANLDNFLNSLTPDNFIQKMQSGEIANALKSGILNESDFTSQLLKLAKFKGYSRGESVGLMKQTEEYLNAAQAFQQFNQALDNKINNLIARSELKLLSASDKAVKKLGGKIENTFGMAPPVEPPTAPSPLGSIPEQPVRPSPLPEVEGRAFPPPIEPPMAELPPVSPVLAAQPSSPVPRSFTPEQATTLGAAQGSAERTGDLLERGIFPGGGGTKDVLSKLAGIGGAKYLLGKAALPAEAAYLGLKGLTSPTAGGEAARASFRALGIEAIAQMAQKYPSYHDGILENPQERRSLTKEIEDDPEMTLEEKAVIQSKVNRGRSLFSPL